MSRRWGLVLGLGLGAAASGHGVAWALPDAESPSGTDGSASSAHASRSAGPARSVAGRPGAAAVRPQAAAAQSDATPTESTDPVRSIVRRPGAPAGRALPAAAPSVPPVADQPVAHTDSPVPAVTVQLPPLPVEQGQSFAVSPAAIGTAANDYVAAGGNPADNPRFFFGDLAVRSLQALAGADLPAEQVRAQLGNLAVSGYFGGVWLRDNLRDAPDAATGAQPASTAGDLGIAALGIRMFDALSAGLAGIATSRTPWIVTTAARASVPVLLTLYGYNRGYLQFLLENPPAGVPSVQDGLRCRGFLDCNSDAFPLEIASRYGGALANLDSPPSLPWNEMTLWTSLMEGATGTGRAVWGLIAQAGAFSPASYGALVDLSSAYLMVGKAAVLSSMQAYAGGDAELARSALLLQAGLWMWSGAYFGGLASGAPRGTMPVIVTGLGHGTATRWPAPRR